MENIVKPPTAKKLVLCLAADYERYPNDVRAIALSKTLRELAPTLPDHATAADLVLFWTRGNESSPGDRHFKAVEGRRKTLLELCAHAAVFGVTTDDGDIDRAREIGRVLADHFEGIAARATLMAVTFRLEALACE